MFHGARTVYNLSEEALQKILHFSLFDSANFKAASFKEHLENCYTSKCQVTLSYVRQLKALRSTARDIRQYVNAMEDAFVCIRFSKPEQFTFEFFNAVAPRLNRTMSIEIRNNVLLPPLLAALQTLILSTPNVVRIAIKGGIEPWFKLQTTDLLHACLVTLRSPPYASLQSLVLQIPLDLAGSIRGEFDIGTLRMHWIREQFTFSPPP